MSLTHLYHMYGASRESRTISDNVPPKSDLTAPVVGMLYKHDYFGLSLKAFWLKSP